MGTQQPDYVIIRPFSEIFRHLDHGAVSPCKANQKGYGFLVLPGRQLMAVDALISRTLHPQRSKLEHR